MNIVTISSQRQITIPSRLLLSIGAKPRGKMVIRAEKGELSIKPLKTSIVQQVAGSLSKYIPPSKRGVPFAKIREETQKIVAAELAKKL